MEILILLLIKAVLVLQVPLLIQIDAFNFFSLESYKKGKRSWGLPHIMLGVHTVSTGKTSYVATETCRHKEVLCFL